MLDPFLLGPGITRLSVRVTRSVRRVARSARRAGEVRYECFLLTGIVSETVSCLLKMPSVVGVRGGFNGATDTSQIAILHATVLPVGAVLVLGHPKQPTDSWFHDVHSRDPDRWKLVGYDDCAFHKRRARRVAA